MKKYQKHIITAVICFLFIVVLNFILPRMLPGNPIGYLTGIDEEGMSVEMYQYYYHALHLDENYFVQFWYYLGSIFDGTLGYSYKHEATVSSLIWSKMGYSLLITIPAMIISVGLGLIWGLHAGYNKGKPVDRVSTSFLLLQNNIPSFLICFVVIIILCFNVKVFPYMGISSGNYPVGSFQNFIDVIYHLILPIFCLVFATLPARFLLVRNLSASYKDNKCVTYAKERGLSDRKIKYDYVFRNNCQPFIVMVGQSIGACFSGTIVIEMIFSINGIGGLLNSAVNTLDYPLMQGLLFVSSFVMILCVIISDIVCILVDPKIRREDSYEKN